MRAIATRARVSRAMMGGVTVGEVSMVAAEVEVEGEVGRRGSASSVERAAIGLAHVPTKAHPHQVPSPHEVEVEEDQRKPGVPVEGGGQRRRGGVRRARARRCSAVWTTYDLRRGRRASSFWIVHVIPLTILYTPTSMYKIRTTANDTNGEKQLLHK